MALSQVSEVLTPVSVPDPGPSSRRHFLHRSALATAMAFLAAACGKKSATTVTEAQSTTAAGSASSAAASASTTVATGSTTTTRGASSTSGPATSASPAGGSFNAGQELAISFAYVAAAAGAQGGGGGRGGPGGQVHNPYVAVWIEDLQGKAIRMISLNYQAGKGDKYLNELRRWFNAERAREAAGGAASLITTISSPTRVPGTYSVVWDGKSDGGALVANGNYFVCIESSRENGPYSLIREQITIDGNPFEKALAAQGELQNAVVKLKSR